MKTVTKYIADDGKEFNSQGACEIHEQELSELAIVYLVTWSYCLEYCRDIEHAMAVAAGMTKTWHDAPVAGCPLELSVRRMYMHPSKFEYAN